MVLKNERGKKQIASLKTPHCTCYFLPHSITLNVSQQHVSEYWDERNMYCWGKMGRSAQCSALQHKAQWTGGRQDTPALWTAKSVLAEVFSDFAGACKACEAVVVRRKLFIRMVVAFSNAGVRGIEALGEARRLQVPREFGNT